jgi:hypothetical protein
MRSRNRLVGSLMVAIIALSATAVSPVYSASVVTQVLKGAAIGYAVKQSAGAIDKAINTITLRNNMKSATMSTKVVPILSVGEKGYIGGAQVSGPSSTVSQVQAVFQYEKQFSNNNYRAKILVPSSSLNPLKLERVPKVGVTAVIDVAINGRQNYWTTGTGIKVSDAARAGALLVAIKNFGPQINSALNTLTLNAGCSTKVVPYGSFGEKTFLGGAQVSASTASIGSVNAVWVYEDLISGGQFRVKIVVPTTSSNPLKMKRVDGAGITAIIDMALSQQKDLSTKSTGRYPVYSSKSGDRDDDRHDNGKHKGWYKGKHNGRKHEWVDEKWEKKLATVKADQREDFIDWLDGRKDRDLSKFDSLLKVYQKEKK